MRIEGPKRLVRRAVFAAKLLGVSGFSLNLSFGDETSYCEQNEDGSFTIVIDKSTHKQLLIEVIAHEMTHLRQYKHDQLHDDEDSGAVLWEGETYLSGGPESDNYWLAPWEMEARAMQEYCGYRWDTRSKNNIPPKI